MDAPPSGVASILTGDPDSARINPHRICIAILALGGQGGGVLTQWIASLGDRGGYRTQTTSVPGVAQRTGATIYYVEMIPWASGDAEPVLSLVPVPDDVDIVLASELMEAGRAILRGFVSRDRTILIASTHRVYAISEKMARGDGIARSETVLAAAAQRARRFVAFDMEAAARQTASAISAVMFGALAGAAALPFPPQAFAEVIQASGKATATNLAGFEAGLARSRETPAISQPAEPVPAGDSLASRSVVGPMGQPVPAGDSLASRSVVGPMGQPTPPHPTTQAGRALRDRILAELPPASHRLAIEGVRRLLDYQDADYAHLYLDRLRSLQPVDDDREDWRLTSESARYLALWMAYEDTIRVADLKVRKTRFERIRKDVSVTPGQILSVTEFMHPRLNEVADTLPPALGQWMLRSPMARRVLGGIFSRGRFLETTSFTGFLLLTVLASLRRWRRSTLRYMNEQVRIVAWLDLVQSAAASDREAAIEIIRCQRLIKGYGETLERGFARFEQLLATYRQIAGSADAARVLRELREKALASTEY